MKYILLSIILLSACGNDRDQSFILEDERSHTGKEEVKDFDSKEFCQELTSQKDYIEFGHMIEALGGIVNTPENYSNSLDGFQAFLDDSNVNVFTSKTLSEPGDHSLAANCGLDNLMPPKGCWLRAATLSLFVQYLGLSIDTPTRLTSFWRPPCYNDQAGGAKASDHLFSKAMDVSFETEGNRRKVQEHICENFWKKDIFNMHGHLVEDELNISVGIGARFMHIGLGSQRGRRYWVYKSYISLNEEPDACWPYEIVPNLNFF